MIRITVTLSNNEVMAISESLKKLEIGGLTVDKVRGRGKTPPPEIHAGKGRHVFQPQFSDKYVIQIITTDDKEDKVIDIVKKHATRGKIIVEPILRAIDIATKEEGQAVI